MPRFRISPSVAALCLVASATGVGVSRASASECMDVRGHLEETRVLAGCTSAVDLCTVAQMFGNLKGEARFVASTISPSVDTATTAVVFVTGNTVIVNAQLGNKLGTLLVKNAAAFRTVGDGDLSDTQVVVGGTGGFPDASGSIRVSGNFVNDSGSADFEGTICIP